MEYLNIANKTEVSVALVQTSILLKDLNLGKVSAIFQALKTTYSDTKDTATKSTKCYQMQFKSLWEYRYFASLPELFFLIYVYS